MHKGFDIQKHIVPSFFTPIARVRIPDYEQINPLLREAILRREAEGEGVSRSNAGGWHSRDDFFQWQDPGAAELGKQLQAVIMNMISFVSECERFQSKVSFSGWANVNRKGSYNRLHMHPEHHWSGVYYVDAGTYDDAEHFEGGKLVIQDPRGAIAMLRHPGTPKFGVPMRMQPENGLFILFPSWIDHSVAPFQSDTVRISIAVNAKIEAFKDISDQDAGA